MQGFYTLRKDVEITSQRVEEIRASAGLQQLEADLADLERAAADSSLWDDHTKAQQTLVALTDVKDKLKLLNEFQSQVEDAETIVKLTEEMDSTDTAFLEEAANIIKELNKALDRFELTQLLSGPYDKEGAVISITAGAGGTDAQDWADMLLRMYVRWGEKPMTTTRMIRFTSVALPLIALLVVVVVVDSRETVGDVLKLPSEVSNFFRPAADVSNAGDDEGIRWAVLIAGSNGYWNYRHQADVCHAYQLLKRGGIKDENIVVFMYDDIAYDEENPRPGVIINSPHGSDVYKGVPKDYTGKDVTVNNFFAAILGNKSAITGGSRKVVDSGPNDHIFIYYSDHGGPGVLGMPTNPYIYADDLIDVLKKKHASGTYKSLVFYLEACESGSMFEGLLPEGLNIYATTASNAEESSWGTYCPGEYPSPPPEYDTCLGDLYSVAWLEDSDVHNLRTETLRQQYELVKRRTSNDNSAYGSHVMQYGDLKLSKDDLFKYMGTNPANDNFTYVDDNSLRPSSKAVNQRDADLLHFWNKYLKAPEGSERKVRAQKQFSEAISHRMHLDDSIKLIGKLLFGIEKGPEVLKTVRPAGQPLVDDWHCLKTLVRTFETHCGSLSQYGMKHMRSIANICNAGIREEQMYEASAQACVTIPSNPWSSVHKGFSA